MKVISKPLIKGVDAQTGLAVIGIEVQDMVIYDPFLSSCGRFAVTPAEYGLTLEEANTLNEFNGAISSAVSDALDEGCKRLQIELDVTDGGFAGMYFSDDSLLAGMTDMFVNYFLAEYEHGLRHRQEN